VCSAACGRTGIRVTVHSGSSRSSFSQCGQNTSVDVSARTSLSVWVRVNLALTYLYFTQYKDLIKVGFHGSLKRMLEVAVLNKARENVCLWR
jgi:hypothetical protein